MPIQEIKDGTVVLRDGTLRKVLMVSSINFSLKSEDEQNATISSYVSFLNSLDHPLQIVIQSRRLQIKPYIDELAKLEREQSNELLRIQTADYRAFVEELVEIGQIMTKRFYVVVPYDPASNKKKNFFTRVKEVMQPALTIRIKETRFQKRKEELDMRVRQIVGSLESMGLAVQEMDTQTLIELYYSSYNPEISFSEQIAKVEDVQFEKE